MSVLAIWAHCQYRRQLCICDGSENITVDLVYQISNPSTDRLGWTDFDPVSERDFDYFVKDHLFVQRTPAFRKSPADRKGPSPPSLLLVWMHIGLIFRSNSWYPRNRETSQLKFWPGHDAAVGQCYWSVF